MLSSKLAVGLLGVALSSLTSCGSADDAGDVGAAVPATEESKPAAEAPAPVVHGFASIDGAELSDDGYAPPELRVGELNVRFTDGRWSWFTPTEDKTLAPLSDATKEALHDEWFAPAASSALPNGDVVVFTWRKSEIGVLTWSERAGEVFTPVPAANRYAVFPQRVLALAPDDIWIAASATTDHFGPDFPGCPSIIRAGQDSGVVAHFDGRRWKVLPYRANGALTGIYPREPGKVEVVADGSYLVSVDGTWEKTAGRVADTARAAGFTIVGDKVLRTRGDQREVVFTPEPIEKIEGGNNAGQQVPRAVHVLPNGEVWLELDILSGMEPYVPPTKQWWAWTE